MPGARGERAVRAVPESGSAAARRTRGYRMMLMVPRPVLYGVALVGVTLR